MLEALNGMTEFLFALFFGGPVRIAISVAVVLALIAASAVVFRDKGKYTFEKLPPYVQFLAVCLISYAILIIMTVGAKIFFMKVVFLAEHT